MKLGKLAKLNNHSTTVFYGVCTGISCNEQGSYVIYEGGRIKDAEGQTLKIYLANKKGEI